MDNPLWGTREYYEPCTALQNFELFSLLVSSWLLVLFIGALEGVFVYHRHPSYNITYVCRTCTNSFGLLQPTVKFSMPLLYALDLTLQEKQMYLAFWRKSFSGFEWPHFFGFGGSCPQNLEVRGNILVYLTFSNCKTVFSIPFFKKWWYSALRMSTLCSSRFPFPSLVGGENIKHWICLCVVSHISHKSGISSMLVGSLLRGRESPKVHVHEHSPGAKERNQHWCNKQYTHWSHKKV